jgi:hypothetical protein
MRIENFPGWRPWNKTSASLFIRIGGRQRIGAEVKTMPEAAEDVIVRNLIEGLARLREDLDRMELWAEALGCFQRPVPEYRPGDQHLLKPSRSQHA